MLGQHCGVSATLGRQGANKLHGLGEVTLTGPDIGF
jgi:hypothetical protein